MPKHDIFLVNPGGRPEMDALEKDLDAGIYMYPYSLLFLQNYLLVNGIVSRIFDMYVEDTAEMYSEVEHADEPIIGVTAQANSFPLALSIIEKLKKLNPGAIIVVGGSFFTNTYNDALERYEAISVVVRGEGEISLLELVKAIRDNTPLELVDGISYRENGSIKANPPRRTEMDIEKFSLRYDKLPITERFKEGILMRNWEKENIRSYPVFLGRGCSRKCAFCEYNQFKYRVRKIPQILAEIDYLKEHYGAEYFTFADPSFCERKKFVKEFCTVLIKDYPGIKWSCEVRVDTPTELLELMAEAGCISVDFGLESGSEKVLAAISKETDLSMTRNYVQTCHNLGIRSHMFLMVSLPEETREDALETIKAARELSRYVTSFSLGVTQILPGTQLERIAHEKGLLSSDFSYYDEKFYHSHTQFCDPNVPLYFEHLDIEFIEMFFEQIMDIRAQKYDSFSILLRKAKTGLLSLHKRPIKKNLVYFKRFFSGIFTHIWNWKK